MQARDARGRPAGASPVPSPPLVMSCVPSAVKAPVRAVPFIFSVPTTCQGKGGGPGGSGPWHRNMACPVTKQAAL